MLSDRGELWYILEKRWYKSCSCDYKVNFNDKGSVFGTMGAAGRGGGSVLGTMGAVGEGCRGSLMDYFFFAIYKPNI